MGLTRILLALAVVSAHTGPGQILNIGFIDGRGAVKIFFIISGFYTALILQEKYNKDSSIKTFYVNRFLRLWPTYIFITLLIMAMKFSRSGDVGLVFEPYWIAVIVGFSNLFILGQEMLYFINADLKSGVFRWCPNGSDCAPNMHHLAYNIPAFTLGIELQFYLLAPFITRLRNLKLAIIFLISIGFHYFLGATNRDIVGYNYHWLPGALAYFLSGVFGYRFYAFMKNRPQPKWLGFLAVAITLALITSHSVRRFFPDEKWVFLVAALLIPFIFRFSAKSKWDRIIGELSYPVYLFHFPILTYFRPNLPAEHFGISVAIMSIAFGIITWIFIEGPVNRVRDKLVNWKKSPAYLAARGNA